MNISYSIWYKRVHIFMILCYSLDTTAFFFRYTYYMMLVIITDFFNHVEIFTYLIDTSFYILYIGIH